MRKHTGFAVEPGAKVFIHQAFKCCPFAGMVTSQVHDYVEKNGYVVVDNPSIAEVHLINTCGSDGEQAQLTYDAIDRVKREGPRRPVIVTGCLTSIDPKRIVASLDGVEHTGLFDPRNMSGLDEVFGHDTAHFEAVPPSLRNRYSGTEFSDSWFHVGVSTGCFGTCSFCAIRRATGRPKSTPIERILSEVDRGIASGQPDILFVSTDASAWGADLGLNVVDLLRAVVNYPGDALFSAEAFEPTLFLEHFEELLPLLTSGRFAFIGVPIQSGNQRILDLMERPYQVNALLDAVARLKDADPGLVVRTDFIYGFGDETMAEFEDSLRVSRHFDIPSFNVYQERPGTYPRKLTEDDLVERREAVMRELRRRSKEGWPRVRRKVALEGEATPPTDKNAIAVADSNEKPFVPPDYIAWMTEHTQRFVRLLARRGPIALGRTPWRITRAWNDEVTEAVVLVVEGGEGSFELGLRRPDRPGYYMALSDRYAMWVKTTDYDPGARRDEAVKAVVAMLELRRRENTDVDVAQSLVGRQG